MHVCEVIKKKISCTYLYIFKKYYKKKELVNRIQFDGKNQLA
jgi:hypothetical protein